MKPSTKKKVNCGASALIPPWQWVPAREIQGTDFAVLRHPIMELAFERVVAAHRPRRGTALLALCTRSRPYINSRTWKRLAGRFGSRADLIATPSGGVIPLQFQSCYPFMTYDGGSEREADEEYKEQLRRRLLVFFRTHEYESLLFVYTQRKRNIPVAQAVIDTLLAEGRIKRGRVLEVAVPIAELIVEGLKMFPLVHSTTLATIDETLTDWEKQ